MSKREQEGGGGRRGMGDLYGAKNAVTGRERGGKDLHTSGGKDMG